MLGEVLELGRDSHHRLGRLRESYPCPAGRYPCPPPPGSRYRGPRLRHRRRRKAESKSLNRSLESLAGRCSGGSENKTVASRARNCMEPRSRNSPEVDVGEAGQTLTSPGMPASVAGSDRMLTRAAAASSAPARARCSRKYKSDRLLLVFRISLWSNSTVEGNEPRMGELVGHISPSAGPALGADLTPIAILGQRRSRRMAPRSEARRPLLGNRDCRAG